MNKKAINENLMTLVQLMGVFEDKAEDTLNATVLITSDPDDPTANKLSKEVESLLALTVAKVTSEPNQLVAPSLEVVIGLAKPKSNSSNIWVSMSDDSVVIASKRNDSCKSGNVHGILILISACHVAARCLRELIGDSFLFSMQEEMRVEYSDIVGNIEIDRLNLTVDLGSICLVGAGAVGNGFIKGLATFDVQGELIIVDPDTVSEGNLNRCILFEKNDVGKSKALQLKEKAEIILPKFKVFGEKEVLSKLIARNNLSLIEKLVVAVDSRRARRSIQSEIPGEVFDASTTGVSEIVLHHHKQTLDGKACLECIYHKEAQEMLHEKHMAEYLGINLNEIKRLFISPEAAKLICLKHPSLKDDQIINEAYDSLFKQLCSTGKIVNAVDKQVFAPLAFVSVLAGAYLSLEVVKRAHVQEEYNYWRLSPWAVPNPQLKQPRKTNKECTFCNDTIKINVANKLWGK